MKPREQAASNKKAYAIDNGFVRAAGFQASPNHGRLLESLVAIACQRRQLRGERRETWQGRSAVIRHQPIWEWLLKQK